MQFRAEMFNIFNHPQFGLPGRSSNSTGGASIRGTLPDNQREIQFALGYTSKMPLGGPGWGRHSGPGCVPHNCRLVWGTLGFSFWLQNAPCSTYNYASHGQLKDFQRKH